MKLNRVLSFILAVTMMVSFLPGGIFYENVQATDAETDYKAGYTWKFDKTVDAFGKTNEFKTLYYGNEAKTVGIVNHEGYGNNWGSNTSRSLKDGLLTSVITASWEEAGHGVYYKLPAALVVGKTYQVSMNLHAAEENTPMTNDKSSSIQVSFNGEVNEKQEWRISYIEDYHNAGAKLSIPAPTSLSTQSDNVVSFEFVATQEIVDAGSWMLITFPMEDGKTYILGDASIKTVNYNYADGYTWKFDKTVDAFGKTNEFKVLYYGNEANTVGIVSSENYANNGSRSLKNGVLTTVITKDADWARGAIGVYYKLPVDLSVGQEYVVSMNLYASEEGTPLVNNKSSQIKLSFTNEPTSSNIWTAPQIEGIHNAETLLTYRAPDYLSTDKANELAVTFVATQAMADNDGWMLISMPLAVNGEVNLGSVTLKEKKDTENHFLNGDFSDGMTGWMTSNDSSYVSVEDSVLKASDKVPTGDVKLYQAMHLEKGIYRLSFDVLGAPTSWRPVYFMGTALDNSSVTGTQHQVSKESGKTEGDWWTVTRDITIETAGTYYFQMNLNQVSGGASVAPKMQYDNFAIRKGLLVTSDLSNAKLTTDIKAVVLGQSYVNTVTANAGYKISKVTVTMGGTEVADAYDAETGEISIAAVTGDLHIQVETVERDPGNLLANGDFEQGSIGWASNSTAPAAIIADGVLKLSTEKTASGDARTYHVMQLKPGAYQLNFDVKGKPQQYRPLISVSKNYWSNDYGQYFMYDYNLSETQWTTVTESFVVPESAADANTGLAPVYVTIWSSNGSYAPVTEMQFDNFVVRKGLPVTADLSNAKLSADVKAVLPGQSYENTVTANAGYKISKVTVTMGGTEVADAYNTETGKISIANVSGELHIQVETVEDETANLLINGNFDQGSTGWANNGVAPVATIADGVLTLSPKKTASGDARTYYTTQLKPGNYKLSFKVKGTPQQYRPLISVSKNYWSNDYAQYFMYKYNLSKTAWTTVTEYFTVPESAADANTGLAPVCITIWSSNASFAPVSKMYFDDFELYKSSHVIVQKPADKKTPKPAVLGSRPNPSPHDDYPYICDEENNLMPNYGFEAKKNYLKNTYSKIVADENAWEGNHSLHYAPIIAGEEAENLLVNGDFAKWNKSRKTISGWQFNNESKLNKLKFVELDGRHAVKLLKCSEKDEFNMELTQRVYLEADFTYTFSFDFYGVAHWGPNLVIYDDNMMHISTQNAKTTGTEGEWTTLSTTYRPTQSGYYVFAVRIHNAAYPQKEQYISNCSVTLKSTRVEYELTKLKRNTNYWMTLFVKASEVASVENSFITFGLTVPETGNFILMEDPSSEGGRPYKAGQQLVPMAYDGQWHVLTVPFNTKELTKLNFTIDGLNCEVWFDNIYIFEESHAKPFVAPTTAKGNAVVTDSNPKLLGCEEDKNLFRNHDLNGGDAFWGDNSHKFGVFGNTVKVADSGSKGYGNALHYVSDRPNGTYYIKWIDVEPNTEYTFSARYAIAQPGEGFMGLINGYRLESEVTENRLFPTMIEQFGFGEENYLESLAWQTAAISFNSGERNRIGFVICDAGGEAYIDELRLFKSSDGIVLENVEDTLPMGQDPADTDLQPKNAGVLAIVLCSLIGVLLLAAMVSLIIIQKKRKNKQ